MPSEVPNSDESFLRLHAAGWSIGDAAYVWRGSLVWLVTGSNGANRIRAEGLTGDAAWWAAVGQAETVGAIGERPEPTVLEGQ